MATILITGGSGYIGTRLHGLLSAKGYDVYILSRTASNSNEYYWNVEDQYINEEAIQSADFIIHLAGANIGKKSWTSNRKKILLNSRVDTTKLLFKYVSKINPELKGFIAASGVGYYGCITSNKIFNEEDNPGNDFLATICKLWEKESLKFNTLNIRTVIFRTGVVFSEEDGVLKKMMMPVKLRFGSILGKGNQYIPWIHLDDLCQMYIDAIEKNSIAGIYNAVAPEHITNKILTKAIAKFLNRTIWLPRTPEILIKFAFGKMAVLLLKGSRVSSEKISNTPFQYKFPTLKSVFK